MVISMLKAKINIYKKYINYFIEMKKLEKVACHNLINLLQSKPTVIKT